MDTFDLYMANEVKKTRTVYIAVGVFVFVLVLLVVLCMLFKYMFDQKEKKEKSHNGFDANSIIPDTSYPFAEKK